MHCETVHAWNPIVVARSLVPCKREVPNKQPNSRLEALGANCTSLGGFLENREWPGAKTISLEYSVWSGTRKPIFKVFETYSQGVPSKVVPDCHDQV